MHGGRPRDMYANENTSAPSRGMSCEHAVATDRSVIPRHALDRDRYRRSRNDLVHDSLDGTTAMVTSSMASRIPLSRHGRGRRQPDMNCRVEAAAFQRTFTASYRASRRSAGLLEDLSSKGGAWTSRYSSPIESQLPSL